MNTKYYCRTFKVPVNQLYVKPAAFADGSFRMLDYSGASHRNEIKAVQTADGYNWINPNKESDTFERLYDRPKSGDILYLLNDEHVFGKDTATLIGPYIWLEHTMTCSIVGSKVLDKYGLYPIHPNHYFGSTRNGIKSVNEGRHTVMFKLKTKNT